MGILSLETTKYQIKAEGFEGPLDLLVHLIDMNKMDIYDINLSEITDQYIAYINSMKENNLEVTSEFLVMASNLLYIKSKGLLPKNEENIEEELSEEELLQRIIEYKKYKEISGKLKEYFDENSRICTHFPEKIELPKQQVEDEITMNTLVEYYKALLNRNEKKINKQAKNIEKIAITDHYTVSSKLKEMYKVLLSKPSFVFNKLYGKKCDREEVVTAFSGLLEMQKLSRAVAEQNKLFGDITVSKAKGVKQSDLEKYMKMADENDKTKKAP